MSHEHAGGVCFVVYATPDEEAPLPDRQDDRAMAAVLPGEDGGRAMIRRALFVF